MPWLVPGLVVARDQVLGSYEFPDGRVEPMIAGEEFSSEYIDGLPTMGDLKGGIVDLRDDTYQGMALVEWRELLVLPACPPALVAGIKSALVSAGAPEVWVEWEEISRECEPAERRARERLGIPWAPHYTMGPVLVPSRREGNTGLAV